MKAIVCLLVATGTAHAFHSATVFDDSAENGGGNRLYFTGSPRGKGYDCSICHTDAAKQIAAKVELTPPVAGAYVPGQLYTVAVTLVGEHRGFGAASNQNSFAAEIVDDLAQPAGTLATPDLETVALVDDGRAVGGISKGNGTTAWTFAWQAPAAGAVTLYVGLVDGDGASDPTLELTDPGGDDVATAAVRLCETAPGCADRPAQAETSSAAAGCDTGGATSLLASSLPVLVRPRRQPRAPSSRRSSAGDRAAPADVGVAPGRAAAGDRAGAGARQRSPATTCRRTGRGRGDRRRRRSRSPASRSAIGSRARGRQPIPRASATSVPSPRASLAPAWRRRGWLARLLGGAALVLVAGCFDPTVPAECPDHVCNGSGGPDASDCRESWVCSSWEAPPGSDQATRTCVDQNKVGTTDCKPSEGPVTLPALDFDKFECEVQPILQRDCAFMGCHGTDTGRPFRDYARGRWRNDEIVNRTGTCIPQTGQVDLQVAGSGTVMCEGWLPHTAAEWKKNFDSARSFMLDAATPEDSLMLRMPTVGGLSHIDIKLFRSTDPAYATIRDWLGGATLGRTCDPGRN
jgi:hypothetical protein